MSAQYFTYRDLRVYQHAKDYVIYVYNLLKKGTMLYVTN